MTLSRRLAVRLAREDGFTMLFALLALFVSSLLVAAAFTAANGDVKLTHRATIQEKAYYAAVAGVDRYQYQLTSSPEYWTKCPSLGTEATPLKVIGTTDENYTVKTLGSTGHTSCESGKQATILETGGTAKGTFRILSTGTVKEGTKTVTRKIVATFAHPGFTKYVYESNYEVEDPVNFGLAPSTCEFYYAYRSTHNLTGTCPVIQFAPTDEVNGPMHTNDAAAVCAKNGNAPKFGREGRNDEIAMNGGHYAAGGCTDAPNIVGKYTTTAGSILPPQTDAELLEAAGTKFDGRTEIELKSGTPNTMIVKNKGTTKTETFPSNGVIYVENSKSEACAITNYTPFGTNTVDDTGCGNVYVHGTYTESLTIASADDVIVNGNLTTTSESSGEPIGSATLGLIAENFVRVYHPVKTNYETRNVVAATQPPLEGKCVTLKELGAKVLKSNEVTEITTTGLSSGDEVQGTVAGEIESETTVSSFNSATKTVTLSKAAKPPAKELSAKITNNSAELKEVNTTGLVTGALVEGTVAGQIETGTTISSINAVAKTVTLNKAAQTSSTTAAGIIVRQALVKEINTTGLVNTEEVEGTGIAAGTAISKVESAKTLLLSSAAKPALKSISGKINKTAEVKEVNTAGLVVGAEVEGSAGLIAAGTTITAINAGAKTITLSNAAKAPVAKSLSGKITGGKTEVTGVTTTGLEVGQSVEGPGAQIEAGTTITAINSGAKTITLSKAAKAEKSETITLKFSGENTTLKFYGEAVTLTFSPVSENTKVKFYGEVTKLKFYHVTGYAYNPVFEGGKCHKVETGYDEYRESENRYIEACEGEPTNYEGEGLCKIEFGTGGCPSRATEVNAAEDPNGWGELPNPVIDAAILSTNHSWIVDNYKCGNLLGTLTVWGSIAQFWRGPVGTSGGSGYIKNYNYDDRLANQQPPSFLAPTNATSWKVSRETAAPASFTG